MNDTVDKGDTPALAAMMDDLGRRARAAARQLARADSDRKTAALRSAAALLRDQRETILSANARDMEAGRQRRLAGAMLDRLMLDEGRIEAMARGLEDIADLPDPVGQVISEWTRPNGLRIQRVRVPLGVIGIIYESRPNVTADAGALCLKAGNAVILRGGSESFHSSSAIHSCLVQSLSQHGLPADAIQMVPTTDRAAVGYLLAEMTRYLDVLVPRGGKSLIARVEREARVPVLGHLEGICHLYVDASARADIAEAVVVNAKMRRTGICGAAETLLLDRHCQGALSAGIVDALLRSGCEVRGDTELQQLDARVLPVQESDWSTEYLDAIISARLVDGVAGAIEHIERYGSGHTESIIAEDPEAVERFLSDVDSAIVMHNASTQFADGGEFGMGAEIGIATGRLHARGPVGAEQLTSFKYVVRGRGQTRP